MVQITLNPQNRLVKIKKTFEGFCKLFFGAMDDLMLKILIVAAFISIIVSMIFEADHRETAWIEGFAILMAVLVVSTVTAWNDYKKEQQFLKLNAFSDSKNNVNHEVTFRYLL